MNRRGFLAGSTPAVAGAGLVGAAKAAEVTSPQPPSEAVLTLSSQLGLVPGKELPEKLASKTGLLPGQDRQEDEPRYLDGFRGLKLIGYQDYCSFECGCRGNREEEIPKSMTFLRECWAKA